jgi:gliding motility-associated-like protein
MNGDTVTISPCKKVLGEIPTVITPNGDGFNDVFKIERMEKYPQNYTEAVVLIYDRWGKLVFESEPGYPEPWDGKDLRGKNLPMDSYFYVIDLRNQSKPVTGHITIVR